jgi:hypothetical protein
MAISQLALARMYLLAIFLGVGLGAVYDVLRITRIFLGLHYRPQSAMRWQAVRLPYLPFKKAKGERRILGAVVFVEDFLFCMLAGIGLILLLYAANSGRFRMLTVLCAGMGFAAYRATLGSLVMQMSEAIAFFVATAVRYVLFFLTLPLRWLWRVAARAVACVALRFLYAERRRKRYRYTKRMLNNAKTGAKAMLLPPEAGEKKEQGGRSSGTGRKKAVQSQPPHARIFGGDGRDVHPGVRQ